MYKRINADDRRLLPPLWLRIVIVIAFGAALVLRVSEWPGDPGIVNALTIVLSSLCVLLSFVWFMVFSGYSSRARLTVVLLVLSMAVLFSTIFRLEGFSGSIVPLFSLRFASASEFAKLADSRTVDLETTTQFDYPGFLGPNRDLTVTAVRLARDWDTRPPELIWRHAIGEGWSAFSVVNGVGVTLEQRGEGELVSAYDIETGKILWGHPMAAERFSHPLGGAGPRSTPMIDGGRVYVQSAFGQLLSLDGSTGKVIWERNLLSDYGVSAEQEAANIQYGRSGSPLILGDLLIIPAGGDPGGHMANLAAYDKLTGEQVWEGARRQISHASPALATLSGREQILTVNQGSTSGHDPQTGALIWEHPWSGITSQDASNSQAVAVPPDRVFISKGYGGGAMLIRLLPRGDGTFDTHQVWAERRVLRTKMTNVVVVDGYIYGLSEGILECVNLETGQRVWKRGRYGHGQILRVADLLLVLSEDGEMSLVEIASDRPNSVLGSFDAIVGKTWNNFALYRDLLVVRNANEAATYRLPLAPS